MFVIKISIITTNYNTDKYLEQTIRNILSQKGDFDLEYIITDGGSKDNSLKIIKKYYQEMKKSKWGRRVVLRFLSEKDNGQSDSFAITDTYGKFTIKATRKQHAASFLFFIKRKHSSKEDTEIERWLDYL